MTPPDSDETMCDCGKHVDGDEFALPAGGHVRAAHQRKPDSGEREVMDNVHPELLADLQANGILLVPLSLAQRILAALEGGGKLRRYGYAEFQALASELRAVVERKT